MATNSTHASECNGHFSESRRTLLSGVWGLLAVLVLASYCAADGDPSVPPFTIVPVFELPEDSFAGRLAKEKKGVSMTTSIDRLQSMPGMSIEGQFKWWPRLKRREVTLFIVGGAEKVEMIRLSEKEQMCVASVPFLKLAIRGKVGRIPGYCPGACTLVKMAEPKVVLDAPKPTDKAPTMELRAKLPEGVRVLLQGARDYIEKRGKKLTREEEAQWERNKDMLEKGLKVIICAQTCLVQCMDLGQETFRNVSVEEVSEDAVPLFPPDVPPGWTVKEAALVPPPLFMQDSGNVVGTALAPYWAPAGTAGDAVALLHVPTGETWLMPTGLTDGEMVVCFAPDRKSVVLSALDMATMYMNLHVYSLLDGSVAKMELSGAGVLDGTFSPTRNEFVYNAMRPGAWPISGELWIHDLTCGKSRLLYHDHIEFSCAFTPDGNHVLFQEVHKDDSRSIMKVDRAGKCTEICVGTSPRLSADGKWLLLLRTPHHFLRNMETGDEQELSLPGNKIDEADFMPDSKRLIFVFQEGDTSRCATMDLETRKVEQIEVKGGVPVGVRAR